MNRRDLIGAGAAALALGACTAASKAPPHAPVVVPFTAGRNGHVYVPVTINGAKTMALVDNGWWVSGVDRDFALAHGLAKSRADRAVTGKAAYTLAGFEWQAHASIEDFSQLNVGGGVPGVAVVVGAEFFARHIVEIDFIGKRLIIHDPSGFIAPAGFTAIALTSPSKAGDVRLPVRVEGGAPLDLILDLGGGHDGLLFKPGATADRLIANRPSAPFGNMGAYRGGKVQLFAKARMFSVGEVAFAGFVLTDVPAATGDSHVAPGGDLNAGSNVIRRFDIIFDTAGRRLWLRPNTDLARPFDHGLTGAIGWTPGPRPGTLRVATVQPGSPAEASGLKPGDLVVRFGGATATPANLQAMQATGWPKAGDVIEVELDDGRNLRIIAARFY